VIVVRVPVEVAAADAVRFPLDLGWDLFEPSLESCNVAFPPLPVLEVQLELWRLLQLGTDPTFELSQDRLHVCHLTFRTRGQSRVERFGTLLQPYLEGRLESGTDFLPQIRQALLDVLGDLARSGRADDLVEFAPCRNRRNRPSVITPPAETISSWMRCASPPEHDEATETDDRGVSSTVSSTSLTVTR
jgi:hypothetical protein